MLWGDFAGMLMFIGIMLMAISCCDPGDPIGPYVFIGGAVSLIISIIIFIAI